MPALERGLPVFTEKPLDRTLEDNGAEDGQAFEEQKGVVHGDVYPSSIARESHCGLPSRPLRRQKFRNSLLSPRLRRKALHASECKKGLTMADSAVNLFPRPTVIGFVEWSQGTGLVHNQCR